MGTTAPAVLSPLVRRESRHRRNLLLALAGMLVLSISPVLGHHLIGTVPWFAASEAHLWVFCLVALHHLLAPVHGVFHLLLYAGIAFALVDRTRAARRHSAVMGALTAEPPRPGSRIARAATRVGLDPARLRLVEGLPNPAFTSGWWHPRVFVARDLATRLAPDEFEAVLAHEAAHVRRRDPLRLFLLRSLAAMLFWLPAIRRLVADVADEAEISADDAAARTHALPLASAILRMAGADVGPPDPAVGFQRADLLERRIRRLAGEDAQVGTHVSGRSIGGAAAALVAVWLSGAMVLHPLPSTGDPSDPVAHCTHPHAWSVSHLFCRGVRLRGLPDACPHLLNAPLAPRT